MQHAAVQLLLLLLLLLLQQLPLQQHLLKLRQHQTLWVLLLLTTVACSSRPALAISNTELFTNSLFTFRNSACELERLRLRCPRGTSIKILWARYGRTQPSYEMCPYMGPDPPTDGTASMLPVELEDTNCTASSSLKVVMQLCQDKSSCRVSASSRTFGGDPCPGTSKYVEAAYNCRPDDFRSRDACEGEMLPLSCKKSHKLAIYSASFGREEWGSSQCNIQTDHRHPACSSECATHTVMDQCQGHRRCRISATDDVFLSDCQQNSPKYLRVIFTCVSRRILKEIRHYERDPSLPHTYCMEGQLLPTAMPTDLPPTLPTAFIRPTETTTPTTTTSTTTTSRPTTTTTRRTTTTTTLATTTTTTVTTTHIPHSTTTTMPHPPHHIPSTTTTTIRSTPPSEGEYPSPPLPPDHVYTQDVTSLQPTRTPDGGHTDDGDAGSSSGSGTDGAGLAVNTTSHDTHDSVRPAPTAMHSSFIISVVNACLKTTNFIKGNLERFLLYLAVSVCAGLILALIAALIRLNCITNHYKQQVKQDSATEPLPTHSGAGMGAAGTGTRSNVVHQVSPDEDLTSLDGSSNNDLDSSNNDLNDMNGMDMYGGMSHNRRPPPFPTNDSLNRTLNHYYG